MNTAIVIAGIFVGAIGLMFAGWSVMNTRKKYYYDFVRRNSVREKLRLPR